MGHWDGSGVDVEGIGERLQRRMGIRTREP